MSPNLCVSIMRTRIALFFPESVRSLSPSPPPPSPSQVFSFPSDSGLRILTSNAIARDTKETRTEARHSFFQSHFLSLSSLSFSPLSRIDLLFSVIEKLHTGRRFREELHAVSRKKTHTERKERKRRFKGEDE